MTSSDRITIMEHLLQYEVELRFSLVHLVSLKKTEVSSTKKMVGVVHNDLVSCGVEKCCPGGGGGGGEKKKREERERVLLLNKYCI